MKISAQNQGMNVNKGIIAISSLMMSLAFSVDANAATAPLKVTSQPSNTTVYEGQSTTFTLNATAGRSMRFYWYKNGVRVGSNSSSYTISGTTTAAAGSYSCRVSDGITSYTCTPFSLAVNQIVRITTQPANVMVNEGSSATLSVAATGTGPLSYQWYFKGAAISGATLSSISTSAATLADAGQYYATVRNGGSSATSSTATMNVVAVSKSYSVSLSWSQPTTRADGTSLSSTDIAGYNLYYATSSTGTLTRLASLSKADLSYVASNLSAGTYYFAASTIDINGLESSPSTRVSKTLQ